MKQPDRMSVAMISTAVATTLAGPLLAHDTPAGFILEAYAFVTDPNTLACDGAGIFYVGRDSAAPDGDEFDFVRIHRVDAEGRSVAEFGDEALLDPDAVAVDITGAVSGTPGAVLVSGHGNAGGYVAAILPDQTVFELFGPTEDFLNVNDMVIDHDGRLLLADADTFEVLVSEAGAFPTTLFTLPAPPTSIAVDSSNRIYTGAEDGVIRIHDADGAVVNNAFAVGLGAGIWLTVGPGGPIFGEDIFAISDLTFRRFRPDGRETVLGQGYEAGDLEFGVDGMLYNSFIDEDIILRMAPIPGNLNGDGYIDPGDLLILLGSWGRCPDRPDHCVADLDGDGLVGPADLIILLGNWS